MDDSPSSPTVDAVDLLAICLEYERQAAALRAAVWRWRLASALLGLICLALI